MSYTMFRKKKTCIQCGRISLCCCCCCWWEKQCLAWQIVKTSIISRCPNHLDWHLWILWSSHSTLKPFQNVFQKQKTRKAPGVHANRSLELCEVPSSSHRPPPGVCSPLYTNDCTSVEPALKLLQFADYSSYSEWRWVHVQTGGEPAGPLVESEPCWAESAQDLLKLSSYNPQQTVPSVDHFRFLGPIFSWDLRWSSHTLWLREGQAEVILPNQEVQPATYSSTIQSVLCTSIIVWFGHKAGQGQTATRSAERIICADLPSTRTCTRPGLYVVPIKKTNLIKLILIPTVVHLKRQNVNIIHWANRLVASRHSWENCFVKSECHFEETHLVQYCSESLFVSNLGETVVLF